MNVDSLGTFMRQCRQSGRATPIGVQCLCLTNVTEGFRTGSMFSGSTLAFERFIGSTGHLFPLQNLIIHRNLQIYFLFVLVWLIFFILGSQFSGFVFWEFIKSLLFFQIRYI